MQKRSQLQFDILTLFPEVIDAYCNVSILKRAQEKGMAKIVAHQIRDYTTDKHHKTDETPYGGGVGMVLKAEPILRAVEDIKRRTKNKKQRTKVIILSAKGKPFTQKNANSLAEKYDHIILIAGRYEGIDERVKTILHAEEISIGPYVTTDGDVAAMVVVSAVARLVPGAIRLESLAEESHWNKLLKEEASNQQPTAQSKSTTYHLQPTTSLEYPHYTRPEVITWKGKKFRVPKVLLTGNHSKINTWRKSKRKVN